MTGSLTGRLRVTPGAIEKTEKEFTHHARQLRVRRGFL
jgi:heme-degrading monooxygenase HmoA